MEPPPAPPPESFFLNVDLDVDSSEDLMGLVQALAPNTFPLERPPGHASFELRTATSPEDPESVILELIRLIQDLPPEARKIWDGASRRTFDIGIQSVQSQAASTYRLTPSTLRAAADVGAEVAITVYPGASPPR